MYPEVSLFKNLTIPTYFLINTMIALVTLFWLRKRAQTHQLSITLALEIYFIVIFCGFWGARFFHVLYEEPFYYLNRPFNVFYFWQGGFVFYGGALLGILAGWAYVHHKAPKDLRKYLDLFAPLGSLSYSLGRIGCFLTGCCYGKPSELPWSIDGRHPTQLYSSAFEGLLLLFLLKMDPTKKQPPGVLFFVWVFIHAIGHFLTEQFRGDDRGVQFLLSISSWISLGLMAFAGYYLKRIYFSKYPR